MTPHPRPPCNRVARALPRLALESRAVRHAVRLPEDGALPRGGGRRLAVIAALAVGGLVAILVPVFFAVTFLGILRG